MNNRIKQIRKNANETQDVFASKLSLSKNFVWMIEKGEREPSDRTLKDICREYLVNEEWLRSGTGDMYKPLDRETEIAQITAQLYKAGDNDFRAKLIKIISQMSEDQLELLKDIVKQLSEGLEDF